MLSYLPYNFNMVLICKSLACEGINYCIELGTPLIGDYLHKLCIFVRTRKL